MKSRTLMICTLAAVLISALDVSASCASPRREARRARRCQGCEPMQSQQYTNTPSITPYTNDNSVTPLGTTGEMRCINGRCYTSVGIRRILNGSNPKGISAIGNSSTEDYWKYYNDINVANGLPDFCKYGISYELAGKLRSNATQYDILEALRVASAQRICDCGCENCKCKKPSTKQSGKVQETNNPPEQTDTKENQDGVIESPKEETSIVVPAMHQLVYSAYSITTDNSAQLRMKYNFIKVRTKTMIKEMLTPRVREKVSVHVQFARSSAPPIEYKSKGRGFAAKE